MRQGELLPVSVDGSQPVPFGRWLHLQLTVFSIHIIHNQVNLISSGKELGTQRGYKGFGEPRVRLSRGKFARNFRLGAQNSVYFNQKSCF